MLLLGFDRQIFHETKIKNLNTNLRKKFSLILNLSENFMQKIGKCRSY